MADGLAEALLGLNVSAADSPYAVGQQAIAQATPQLITPYTSTGKAIGLSLGSVLLQSLLAYQARSSALQDTLQANTLANQMLKLQTPEERTAFIGQADVSPLIGSKLSTLATALTQQEQARKLEQASKLGDLTTAAEFQLGPLGSKLYERDIAKEIARQSAISSGFQTRQELADELLRGRELQRKELGLQDVNVPNPIWQRAIERNASSDLALDVAGTIDQYKSIPEFTAAKNISAFGDDQLKSRLRNLATVVLQSRSGLAATDKERENLHKILTGDFTAVSPDTVSGILKRFAKDEKEIAAGSVAAGTQRPEDFVSEVMASAREGRKSAFSPRVPDYGQTPPETPAVSSTEQRKEELRRQIAEIKSLLAQRQK